MADHFLADHDGECALHLQGHGEAGGLSATAAGPAAMGHDPRTEAFERLGGDYEVRILEPSPPAVAEAPWFANDPAARSEVPADRTLVSPVRSGDRTWDELARADGALAAWCADRWLGAWRRLEPLPPQFAGCRDILHAVAEGTLMPAPPGRQRQDRPAVHARRLRDALLRRRRAGAGVRDRARPRPRRRGSRA